MIELAGHPAGIILPVKAQPGARANALRGVQDGALKVAVTQIAEKGKANQAIHALLCKKLGLKKSQLELLSGPTASLKQFLVRDLSRDELARRLIQQCPSLAKD